MNKITLISKDLKTGDIIRTSSQKDTFYMSDILELFDAFMKATGYHYEGKVTIVPAVDDEK